MFLAKPFSTLTNEPNFALKNNFQLELNKRLAPEIYIDLVVLLHDKEKGNFFVDVLSGIEISEKYQVVEYGIRMVEIPQECSLENILECEKEVKNEAHLSHVVDLICEKMVTFYDSKPHAEEHRCSREGIKQNCEMNLRDISKAVEEGVIEKGDFQTVKDNFLSFFDKFGWIFDERCKMGFVKEVHGDIHTGK